MPLIDLFGLLPLAVAIIIGLYCVDTQLSSQHTKKWLSIAYLLAALSIVIFMYASTIDGVAAAFLAAMFIASATTGITANTPMIRSSTLIAILIAVAAAIHQLPGLDNIILFENVTISVGSSAIDLTANLGKGLAGLSLLVLVVTHQTRTHNPINVPDTVTRTPWFLIPGYIFVILATGWATGLAWDFKLTHLTVVFFISNAVFSVIAEEALFRGILQARLSSALQRYSLHGPILSIVIISVVFGLAHLSGGLQFSVLATVASILYGLSYHYTGKLSATIITHAGVNIGHFIFLQYPVPF